MCFVRRYLDLGYHCLRYHYYQASLLELISIYQQIVGSDRVHQDQDFNIMHWSFETHLLVLEEMRNQEQPPCILGFRELRYRIILVQEY